MSASRPGTDGLNTDGFDQSDVSNDQFTWGLGFSVDLDEIESAMSRSGSGELALLISVGVLDPVTASLILRESPFLFDDVSYVLPGRGGACVCFDEADRWYETVGLLTTWISESMTTTMEEMRGGQVSVSPQIQRVEALNVGSGGVVVSLMLRFDTDIGETVDPYSDEYDGADEGLNPWPRLDKPCFIYDGRIRLHADVIDRMVGAASDWLAQASGDAWLFDGDRCIASESGTIDVSVHHLLNLGTPSLLAVVHGPDGGRCVQFEALGKVSFYATEAGEEDSVQSLTSAKDLLIAHAGYVERGSVRWDLERSQSWPTGGGAAEGPVQLLQLGAEPSLPELDHWTVEYVGAGRGIATAREFDAWRSTTPAAVERRSVAEHELAAFRSAGQ